MAGHRFHPDKADKLIDPKRKSIIDPDKLIALLDIRDNDLIADLGAGNGFLTIPFAQKTKETVYAVDIEPRMLNLLRERASEHKLTNIQYIESDLEQIYLPENSVNKAIVAFVMHEVPNMDIALKEFERIVKPDGELLIVEWEAVESDMGPPIHERISSIEMKAFIEEAGFHPEIHFIHDSAYAITVKK